MELLFPIAGMLMLIGTPLYLHAVSKFESIVQEEHPEWVNCKGSLSFFTRACHASQTQTLWIVVGIAFSSRWRTLQSPYAAVYVGRIRFLLPLLIAVFGVVLVTIAVLKP